MPSKGESSELKAEQHVANPEGLAKLGDRFPETNKAPLQETESAESIKETSDLSLEEAALEAVLEYRKQNKTPLAKDSRMVAKLATIAGSLKQFKLGKGKDISPEDREIWDEYVAKKGLHWELLNREKPERVESSSEIILTFADIPLLEDALVDIKSSFAELPYNPLLPELRSTRHSFETIINYLNGEPVYPTPLDTKRWQSFKAQKGKVYELVQKALNEKVYSNTNLPHRAFGITHFKNEPQKIEIDHLLKGVKIKKMKSEKLEPIRVVESHADLPVEAMNPASGNIDRDKLRNELIAQATKETYGKGKGYKEYEARFLELLYENGFEDGKKPEVNEGSAAVVQESIVSESEKNPKKEESVSTPESIPLPAGFSPRILEKISTIKGLTPEMLQSIPELASISDSEGKTLWFVDKLINLKVRRDKNEAKEAHERDVAAAGKGVKGFAKRMLMNNGIVKGWNIKEKAEDIAKNNFNLEAYKEDIAGLVHLAEAGPDMKVKEDGSLIAEYLEPISGIKPEYLEAYNERATAYAQLPPEYEWKHHSKDEQKKFEAIKKSYIEEKAKTLKTITEHGRIENGELVPYNERDALHFVNDADFNVAIHQTLNNYPNAEIELKKLAESKGWNGKKEMLKEQFKTGGWVAVASFATRLGFKTAVGATVGAAALPITSALLGAGFGFWRGGRKAEENLKKEEELMRLGFEGQTKYQRNTLPKIHALLKQKELWREQEAFEKKNPEGVDPYSANRIKSHIQEIDEKIKALRTNNFIKAEDNIEKINRLREKIANEPDEAKWRKLQDQLEVRLEFTRKKLADGKITFGKEGNALANRLSLIQTIGAASGDLAVLPNYEHAFFTRAVRGNVRRSRLEKVLIDTEERIAKAENGYVWKQRFIGAVTGGTMAGLGSEAASLVHGSYEGFGSRMWHDIHDRFAGMKEVNYGQGRGAEKAVTALVGKTVGYNDSAQLINESTPTPSHPMNTGFGPTRENAARLSDLAKQHAEDQELANDEAEMLKKIKSAESMTKAQASTPVEGIKVEKAIPIEKFEIKLTNESQSREYALIKYYEGKGMSHEEAGKKAYKAINHLYGEKGERQKGLWVHKGDKIIITEEKGEPVIEVIPKVKVPVEHVSVTSSIDNHVMPQPKTSGPASIPVEAPDDKVILKPFLTSTPTSETPIDIDIHSPAFEQLSSYEVTKPSNGFEILYKISSLDTRVSRLSTEMKNKVLFHLIVDNFMNHLKDPDFSKKLNIGSGNFFDIKSGTIHLNALAKSRDMIGAAIKAANKDTSTHSAHLIEHLAYVNDYFKDMPPQEWNANLIHEALQEVEEQTTAN